MLYLLNIILHMYVIPMIYNEWNCWSKTKKYFFFTDIHYKQILWNYTRYLYLYAVYLYSVVQEKIFKQIKLNKISWFPRLWKHTCSGQIRNFFWRLSYKKLFLNFAQKSWERRFHASTRASLYEAFIPGLAKKMFIILTS